MGSIRVFFSIWLGRRILRRRDRLSRRRGRRGRNRRWRIGRRRLVALRRRGYDRHLGAAGAEVPATAGSTTLAGWVGSLYSGAAWISVLRSRSEHERPRRRSGRARSGMSAAASRWRSCGCRHPETRRNRRSPPGDLPIVDRPVCRRPPPSTSLPPSGPRGPSCRAPKSCPPCSAGVTGSIFFGSGCGLLLQPLGGFRGEPAQPGLGRPAAENIGLLHDWRRPGGGLSTAERSAHVGRAGSRARGSGSAIHNAGTEEERQQPVRNDQRSRTDGRPS